VISKRQTENAWAIVAKLHHNPSDSSQTFAREEFHQMTEQHARDKAAYGHVTIIDMFREPQFAKRMLAAGVVMASSQLTGTLSSTVR
jgi:hypothetical protein